MSLDDEYAAIGIDLRALRRAAGGAALIPAHANPVSIKIGLAVLRLRLYWGWSQRDLGRRAGVDQSTISRLERGRQEGLAMRRYFAILAALRVGDILMLPRPPVVEHTSLELMLSGDPWKRAVATAARRVNRRRSA